MRKKSPNLSWRFSTSSPEKTESEFSLNCTDEPVMLRRLLPASYFTVVASLMRNENVARNKEVESSHRKWSFKWNKIHSIRFRWQKMIFDILPVTSSSLSVLTNVEVSAIDSLTSTMDPTFCAAKLCISWTGNDLIKVKVFCVLLRGAAHIEFT